ncbi:MAG: hypothetical protein L0387_37500 [Acidobacteria bacterium]|nr:hypothetical protein [Acidobacteriota bacterium]MCI0720429.1 hypothetical protein [Acidobacteriota bacterium]
MTFNKFNRRTHLYLAMFLLPWFFMYGISSMVFNHRAYFKATYDDRPRLRFEREYRLPTMPPDASLRDIGARILADNGLEGTFGPYRPNKRQLNLHVYNFWSASDVIYYEDEYRLVVKDYKKTLPSFLTGIHARGGFQQPLFLHDAWAILVDIVMVSILLWIATGLYMWYHLPHTWLWGAVALGSGAASFLIFVLPF